jgi:ribosomal protein S27AE
MSFHSEDMSDEYGIKDREMMRLEKQALQALLEHWPTIHKAIRSDIQLAEAAESIAAIAEFERIARTFKCATFDQSEITPEIRALMNEGRRKAEQSKTGVYDASKDYERLSNMPEWEQGLHACLGGLALEANPYKTDSEQGRAWGIGWKEAYDELPDETQSQRSRSADKCPKCGNTTLVAYHGFGKRCLVCQTLS